MKEMSHEASQLIHAGREAFRPTEADRARLMAALTGAATLSVGVAAAAGTQRSLSAILGVGHAGRLLAIALPVAAAGTYWWHTTVRSPSVQTALPAADLLAAVIDSSTAAGKPGASLTLSGVAPQFEQDTRSPASGPAPSRTPRGPIKL